MTRKFTIQPFLVEAEGFLYKEGPLFSPRLSDPFFSRACLFVSFLVLELFSKRLLSRRRSHQKIKNFRSRRHPRRSRRRCVSDCRHGPDDLPGDGRGDLAARLGLGVRRERGFFFPSFRVSREKMMEREEKTHFFQQQKKKRAQCLRRHQEDVQGARRQGLLPGGLCDRPEADHQLGEQAR